MLTQTSFSSPLFTCTSLSASQKPPCFPGHPSLPSSSSSLDLSATPPPLYAAYFSPSAPRSPFALLFCAAESQFFQSLHVVPRSPFAAALLLDAAQTRFLHLTSSLPGRACFSCLPPRFPSLFLFVFSPAGVASQTHSCPKAVFESLVLMRANCHTEMRTHTSSYVTKPLRRAVHREGGNHCPLAGKHTLSVT